MIFFVCIIALRLTFERRQTAWKSNEGGFYLFVYFKCAKVSIGISEVPASKSVSSLLVQVSFQFTQLAPGENIAIEWYVLLALFFYPRMHKIGNVRCWVPFRFFILFLGWLLRKLVIILYFMYVCMHWVSFWFVLKNEWTHGTHCDQLGNING